jgi:hypothetical protein
METINRTIPSGETVIFDKKNRDLYIITPGHGTGALTPDAARQLAAAGKAEHYDKAAVERLHHALSVVILLSV